jgi:hypothetical protein
VSGAADVSGAATAVFCSGAVESILYDYNIYSYNIYCLQNKKEKFHM